MSQNERLNARIFSARIKLQKYILLFAYSDCFDNVEDGLQTQVNCDNSAISSC